MGTIIPITMPKFGLAMTEGKVASWAKPEGAEISVGDEIADIETAKITNAYESPVKGTLRRHVAAEQEELPVGALIAVVADSAVQDRDIDNFIVAFQAEFASGHALAQEEAAPKPVSIEVNGRTIRYLEAGRGHEERPIVLIHGFGGDINNWMFNQPALAESNRVIALDLPGHGGSSKDVGAGDLATLSAAVVGLLAALDIPKAHLVGHSLGAAVALRTALDKPAHVASLTLISPAGFGEEIDGSYIKEFITAGRRKQMEPVLEKLFKNKGLVSRDMIEEMLKYKRLDGVAAALATVAAANFPGGRQKEVMRGRLMELGDIPVRVIWGREDELIPARHAEGLPSNIRTQILPDAGHMPQMEKAADINRLIVELVASE
jgi:pyruvate dehydrogenase E2 component (dihydrolipoamide acetyltransferase)